MKKFWSDFKAFISKGNIVDLAVAVIVGGAFGKIVSSLVNDIIMPLISLIIGGANVTDWKWVIKPAVYDSEGILVTAETALMYGNFIQTIIDFLIVAFFIFLALRIVMNSQKRLEKLSKKVIKNKKGKEEVEETVAVVEETKTETAVDLLKEIRDLLKENKLSNNQIDTIEKQIKE